MNRVLKFRAWDTIRKEYLSAGELLLGIQSGCRPDATKTYLDVLKDPDMYKNRFIIEQYTELDDKNGKEIFEGDICKDSLGWIFEVIWDSDNARFLGRHAKPRGDTYICYVGRVPAAEVIGDIHYNPEFLTGEGEPHV